MLRKLEALQYWKLIKVFCCVFLGFNVLVYFFRILKMRQLKVPINA